MIRLRRTSGRFVSDQADNGFVVRAATSWERPKSGVDCWLGHEITAKLVLGWTEFSYPD